MVKNETVMDFLNDYDPELDEEFFPARYGRWVERDETDPMWRMSTLRAAAKKGIIELEEGEQYGGGCRWRFTMKALEMKEKQDG